MDTAKAGRVKEAMQHVFKSYRTNAWGYDGVDPLDGKPSNNLNGWAAFIVESSPTLALMGMWEEFSLCIGRLLDSEKLDFDHSNQLVEPFNATTRYLGAMVSLLELGEADLIPESALSVKQRVSLVERAVELGKRIQVAYQSTTGIPFPRVDFKSLEGKPNPKSIPVDQSKAHEKEYAIEPSQVGGVFVENAALTRITGDSSYLMHSVKAWSSLVWDKYIETMPGLISGPIDVFTAQAEGSQRHWDSGHVEYYDTLIKAAIWAPGDRLTVEYKRRWLEGAAAVRHNLSSRSVPANHHLRQHLHLGKWEGPWFLNEMSQAACSAPSTLILGGTYTNRTDYIILGKAVLEACHHVYASSPSRLGPESWSWTPMPGVYANGSFSPESKRARREVERLAYWTVDPRFTLRPAYFASLFYAWRITGEQRYRDWAWDAFVAIEKHCKTKYGFAGLRDTMSGEDGDQARSKDTETALVVQTLKYLWLTFADTDVLNLDRWIFSTAGHAFRRA